MFEKREFTIEENGVTVFFKNLVQSNKQFLRFENVPPRSEELTRGSRKLFLAVIVLTFLALVSSPLLFQKDGWEFGVTMWILCLFFWIGFIFARKSFIMFVQNKAGLILFKDTPSSQKVSDFIKKFFETRNAYLLKKYGQFTEGDTIEDKIGRLNFLRTMEVISEGEFEAKSKEFKGLKPAAQVGFAPLQP
jgi:hypothetical protein